MAIETLNGFLLPPGKYEEKAVPPGEWREFDGFSFLAGIADKLDVRNVQGDMDDIISIPDLWAQVAGFAGALAAPRHPRHATTVTEWRGLVALLALGQVRGLPLDFLSLTIDDGAALRQNDEFLPFGAVAVEHSPAHRVTADMDWQRLVVLRYNQRPVGLFNPWTLLCPVRDHQENLDSALPWAVNGQILDPISGNYLDRHDMEMLVEYCQRMARKLAESARTKAGDFDVDLVNLLAKHFNDFVEDIRRVTAARQLGNLNIPAGDPVSYPGSDGLPHWLYRELTSSGDPGGVPDGYDIMVATRPEFSDLLIGALLIDPTLVATFDTPTTAIKAWRRHSLASLINPSQTLRDDVLDQLASAKVAMISPDDLFTPYLLRMKDGSFPGHGGQAGNFILPLTPLMLLFMGPDEIRKSLSIRAAGQGFEVEVSIRLQSQDGIIRTHRLKRPYSSEKVVEATRPTALTVWPNFVHPEWPRYFVMNKVSFRGRVPRGRGLATVKALREILGTSSVGSIAGSLVAATSRLDVEDMPNGQSEILAAEGPVEAVICDIPSPAVGAEASDRIAGGLIIFRYSDARPPVGRGASFRVGIDFGTTNTAVYARLNDNPPKPLLFANRFVHATDGDNTKADETLSRTLIPARDITSPFLTALMTRSREKGVQVRTLLTDHIEFGDLSLATQLGQMGEKDLRQVAMGDRVRYDIKWGTSADDRRLVRAFLSQAVLMAAAEAIDNGADFRSIQWNFSYPEAFSRSQREGFKSIVPMAVEDALGEGPQPQSLKFRPESFATALYFNASEKAYFHDTAIAIDVGGKTSDISIWQDGKPIWESSLKFAGRDLLINFLARNPDLFKIIDCQGTDNIGETACGMVRKEAADLPYSVTHVIEAVVNNSWYANAFERNYPIVGGEAELVKLRLLAVLSLSGLIHYVAQVISHVRTAGEMRGDDPTVTICMGGRGSLLFKSYFGEAARIQPFAPLANFFHRTSGLVRKPDTLRFSDRPKSEVAFGLLVDRAPSLGGDVGTVSRALPLGCEIMVDGTSYPPTSLLGDLPVNMPWRLGSIDAFRAFLMDVQTECNLVLPLHLLNDTDFLGGVSGALHAARINGADGGDSSEDTPEPPFIILLRKLVERIAIDADVTIRES